MSLLFVLCVYLIQLIQIECQTEKAGIYAIGGFSLDENNNIIETSLVKYDINTGNSTLLYHAEFNWTKNAKSCFDDKHNIWYFIVNQIHLNQHKIPVLSPILASYNLETNKRLSDIPLYKYFNSLNNVDCVGDPNTGDIYLFGNSYGMDTNNGTAFLLQMKTSQNNTINKIAEYNNSIFNCTEFLYFGVKPIFDSQRNMAWFNGAICNNTNDIFYGFMYYIDIITGDIHTSIAMDNFPFVRSGIFNEKLDKIIGLQYYLSQNKSFEIWEMEYANPVNLDITNKINGFSGYCPFYYHSPTIDITNNIFYEIVGAAYDYNSPYFNCSEGIWFEQYHLLGIDINNGNIITQPQIAGDTYPYNVYQAPFDILYWNGE